LDDPFGKLLEAELKCSSIIDLPQSSPVAHRNGLPEMDAFMWVTREEAYKMTFKTQQFLFSPNFVETQIENLKKFGSLKLDDGPAPKTEKKKSNANRFNPNLEQNKILGKK
jgi:hypothetical protein